MSKYNELWENIGKKKEDTFRMSFEEIQEILGFPIDHSFLNSKKELLDYGYEVQKISLKEKYIIFNKK